MTVAETVVLHALKHPKFDIYHAQLALESLGLWDAEVLEGQLQPGLNDDGTSGDDWLDVDGAMYCMSDLMERVEYGQRVRVIVLPQEEK